MSGPFLLLHPDDNVLVARANAPEGTEVVLDSGPVHLSQSIPMAHKIARVRIAVGETIRKYGMPIGIATADIAPGANVTSDYLPTYTLDSGHEFLPEAH